MAKSIQKKQAIFLRKKGASVGSIAQQLEVSKSTASLWCSEIKLTSQQKKRLQKNKLEGWHKGRIKAAQLKKDARQQSILLEQERAQCNLGKLSNRDILMVGFGLYWGEGSKNNERRYKFTNSV